MKVDYNDVKEDYARLNAEISSLTQELEEAKALNEQLKSAYKKANDLLNEAGEVIGYPAEWDVSCYDSLKSALINYKHCLKSTNELWLDARDELEQLKQSPNAVVIMPEEMPVSFYYQLAPYGLACDKTKAKHFYQALRKALTNNADKE